MEKLTKNKRKHLLLCVYFNHFNHGAALWEMCHCPGMNLIFKRRLINYF